MLSLLQKSNFFSTAFSYIILFIIYLFITLLVDTITFVEYFYYIYPIFFSIIFIDYSFYIHMFYHINILVLFHIINPIHFQMICVIFISIFFLCFHILISKNTIYLYVFLVKEFQRLNFTWPFHYVLKYHIIQEYFSSILQHKICRLT